MFSVQETSKQKKKEKVTVPKVRISLRKGVPEIIKSPVKKTNKNFDTTNRGQEIVKTSAVENVGYSETIADKVKLRKRGRGTSNAENFKMMAESSLPAKKRRKSSCGSSLSSLSPTAFSSPFSSPLSAEDIKIKNNGLSLSDKKDVPSLTSGADALTVHSQQSAVKWFPPSTCERPILTTETHISNDNAPIKNQLDDVYPFVIGENQSVETSAASNMLDIHHLEVASYEEVASDEPFHVSSSGIPNCDNSVHLVSINPREVSVSLPMEDNIKHIVAAMPDISASQGVKSPTLYKKDASNKNKVFSKICHNINRAAVSVSANDHAYPVNLNDELLLKDIDVDKLPVEYNVKKLEVLDSSVVQDYFSRTGDASTVENSSNGLIHAITDLAIQIQNNHNVDDPKRVPYKVNGLVNQVSPRVQLSSVKHSSQARASQNTNGIKKGMCSSDSANTSNKQISRSPNHSSSFKITTKEYKSTRLHNGAYMQENLVKEKEKRKAMDERCIVYVGNIPFGYSDEHLRKRFQKFGVIKDIQIKSKVRCDGPSMGSKEMRKYGFITFSSNQEATDAIENGNKDHGLKFQISFGARRQFVGEEYKDLDGIVAANENSMYKHNSRSSFHSQNKDYDFDKILKDEMKVRGVKPQPFRMKCKA